MRRPAEFSDFPTRLEADSLFGWGPYRAVVRKVIDGDTLDVLLDLGFQCYAYQTLRLRGVNAPERNTLAGRVAQTWLREQLPEGTPVVVTPFKDATTFGRYVADVRMLTEQGVVEVATALLDAGHATRMTR